MSKIILTKGIAPEVTDSNKGAIFFDVDNRVKQIDQNGVISFLNVNGLRGYNILHNGGFRVLQRQVPASTSIPAVSTTTRAGQIADRWAITTSVATNLNFQQVDTAGTQDTGLTARYYGSSIASTAGKKIMLSQAVLSSDMSHLRGKKVRVSIKHNQKVGSGQTYYLGLLELAQGGTVDVLPAFLTGAWSTTTGVDPTFGAFLHIIPPDALPTGENGTVGKNWLTVTSVATTWTRSSAVFTVPFSAKNLVFVFFSDATGGSTDNISFSEAQITEGTEIVDYVELPFTYELTQCQRFFSKSFPYAILPAASVSVANGGYGSAGPMLIAGNATALGTQIPVMFPVRMWKAPAVTLYTPVGAGAVVYRHTGTTPAIQGTTAVVASSTTDRGCLVSSTNEATANTAVGNWCSVHWKAEADFIL